MPYISHNWYVKEVIHNISVLIILQGKGFPGVGKKFLTTELAFSVFGKISDMQSGLRNQMRKIDS